MDILLVDDSKTMRGIVQRAIRQAGFRGLTVGEAENGVQALEKLRTDQPKLIHRLPGTGEGIGEPGAFRLHHLGGVGGDQRASHEVWSELPDHQTV